MRPVLAEHGMDAPAVREALTLTIAPDSGCRALEAATAAVSVRQDPWAEPSRSIPGPFGSTSLLLGEAPFGDKAMEGIGGEFGKPARSLSADVEQLEPGHDAGQPLSIGRDREEPGDARAPALLSP